MSAEDQKSDKWVAVLADMNGFTYATVAEAIEALGEEDEVEIRVEIRIVRGTAAPHEGRLPGSYQSGDLAAETYSYLVDPDDASVGAEVRYAQAQAMAAGLNGPYVRKWSLPPEPGPEVLALEDEDGDVWVRDGEYWCHGEYRALWVQLFEVAGSRTFRDATPTEGGEKP